VPDALWLVAGVVIGGVAAWAVARTHAGAAVAAARAELQARLAAAETRGDVLQKQLSQRELDLTDLQRELAAERSRRIEAATRADALRENLEEQRRLLDEARAKLGDAFKALSADVLRENRAAFLEQAREAVDANVRPLQEALDRYEAGLRALEATRQQAYGGLRQQLEALAAASGDLQRETGNLVTALRGAQVRGRWGELTLRRVVELAGLVEHCDFEEQTVAAGDARLRPDMIVRLPGRRDVIVDAKAPLDAYFDAMNAATPEERAIALARHARQVRQHMQALAGKAYWDAFGKSAEFVVMFIPGEAFVGAAAQTDPALLEDGINQRVVIATPTTLIALLRAINYGWRQEQLAANAERISELGRQLYDRLRTLGGHFESLAAALRNATNAFNQAVGSLEARVLPTARKFRELGAAKGDELPVLGTVDEQPRALDAPEFPRQLEASDTAS
jgi:DNA recombination protein RmuC